MSLQPYAGDERRARPSDYDERIISKAEMRETFKEAAQEVIHGAFSSIGIELSDSKSVSRARESIEWSGNVKDASSEAAKSVVKGAGYIAGAALIGTLIVGFKDQIRHFVAGG